ncbi:hypothetical protein [Paludisphaera mucosa]|uniref:Cytochrome c domain-containing protein n=1 Tax=Paludisphaera mucosa TaxID=3030827 RepID=A0ABT6F8K8_9BACT|nr:hypothetical protein [Paludisphaera mucosa]MDG3003923.1 hypothetical protein [Paludisphaera mucosa]
MISVRKAPDLATAGAASGFGARPAGFRGPRGLACGLVLSAAVLGPLGGCSRSGGVPPDDEAMVRARFANRTPQDAAKDYAPPHRDYFPRMDVVGRKAEGATDWPDQLVDLPPTPASPSDERRPAIGLRPKRDVGALPLSVSEAIGRNTWMSWCSGNEGFWDWLANNSFGASDLLKLLDSRNRATVFRDAGIINEPEMMRTGAPEATDFGLWLNVPSDAERRAARAEYLKRVFDRQQAADYDPRTTYPRPEGAGAYGAAATAKTPTLPPDIYGLSSGVIGLRLFPNPKFDGKARAAWDADRYYNDPDYYGNPDLVRPFRVGMACAFCHTSFHPLNPPRDITDPRWENLSGNTGAQYLRIRGVFGNLLNKDSFVYHLLDSQPPGTIDTSLLPSDNINNTNTMNSIFALPQRVALSLKNPKETLTPASAKFPSLWGDAEIDKSPSYLAMVEYLKQLEADLPEHAVAAAELAKSNENPRRVPRILLDGSDSIGGYGALARVYLNIGSYWEQWIRINRLLVGFQPQEPFRIEDCEAHSLYWIATQERVGPMRDYFLKITPPMRLLDVQDDLDRTKPVDEPSLKAKAEREKADFAELLAAERARRIDTTKLEHGRQVFARNCIVCHSSIQPAERHAEMQAFADRGEYWDHDPGRWLADPRYRDWAKEIVKKPAFWLHNYLSTDYRIPIDYVGTNSARAVATNAMTGHMWQDFSSADYQKLPPEGAISFFNPFLGESGGPDQYTPRHKTASGVAAGGGGPGFYRVPTLVSIWAGAPLLHNNSLGLFNNDPSVDGRLLAFDDAIRKLLWPDRRLESSSYNGATPERLKQDHGLIWRTPVETWLTIPARHVPYLAITNVDFLMETLGAHPWLRDRRLLFLPAAFVVLALFGLLRATSLRRRWLWGYIPLFAALGLAFVMAFLLGRVGEVRLGPIPEGTPVNLLANINPEADPEKLRKAAALTTKALAEIRERGLKAEATQKVLHDQVAPALLEVSKCPDLVMDRGHDFPWFKTMTDDDKDALIELLKTF